MSKIKYDLTGQVFGYWTVKEQDKNSISRDMRWICECNCGTIKSVLGKNLRNGRSKSCGCLKKEQDRIRMIEMNKNRALDLRGQKYGLLTPICPAEKEYQKDKKSIVWKCLCDCGNITYVTVDNLRGQHPVRSCGCLGSSIGEYNISQILNNNHISYIKEYHPVDGYGRYDFAILNETNHIIKLIEFDGEQHYNIRDGWNQPYEDIQERDEVKNKYALERNIPLVRIPYWERDNITLEMIMGDKYLVRSE